VQSGRLSPDQRSPSTFTSPSCTICFQRGISLRRKAPNSSGVLPIGSMPMAESCPAKSGSLSARPISPFGAKQNRLAGLAGSVENNPKQTFATVYAVFDLAGVR
jgi:hypothetical protein